MAHLLPLQFAKKNSRTLRKGLRDLCALRAPDIVSLEADVQNFSTNSPPNSPPNSPLNFLP